MTPQELAAFARLEAAIDQHPLLKRIGEPDCRVNRSGYSVRIQVKHMGSRKTKPDWIHEPGDSIEVACANLIQALDLWAQAIK